VTRDGSAQIAEAVFVVGVSRSGTSLMRRILGRHSQIAIAPENHYLGHLLPRYGVRNLVWGSGDLHRDEAVRELVGRLYGPEVQRHPWLRESSYFWSWLGERVPAAELERLILAGERSERGVFTALLRAYADVRGKPIMGEKTPAHIEWAETLLDWYPEARIVHMVRDPRAIYVSELRRRLEQPVSAPYRWLVRAPPLMGVFVLHLVAWEWARALARHRRLARAMPRNYRMVRFEDLVREPEATVEALSAFLGVPMERRMLRQKMVSHDGRQGRPGIDPTTATRWRELIDKPSEWWLRRLLGARLAEVGYDDPPARPAG
jgi:Sulfotransferase family